ncbi:MAG: MlaE family lipid ABC transporter permease subunit [Planctomycetaceae bacterium]|nr:MAG: MlaE family lipid ABC transporter permease subunit [Planctomycetaceae bacterium]
MDNSNTATVDWKELDHDRLCLVIKGRLDVETTGSLWRKILKTIAGTKPRELLVDASQIEYCDGAGIGLLLELTQTQKQNNRRIQITGLSPDFQPLMKLFDPGQAAEPPPKHASLAQRIESLGKKSARLLQNVKAQISFIGEAFVKLLTTLIHPRTLRWRDTFLIAEKAGANAVGITALLGFLIGMILAFQSAVSMQKFGAQVFVTDLVCLALFRELGPLITAFVLASRSGSAFAAEIGTMKINEEIDALTTMGLDPVRFLVVPRLIAAICVLPLLTMFNNLFGLIGCGMVMSFFGSPPITYLHRIQQAATMTDLCGGLAKTFVFGALIAGIGCLQGIRTGTGPSAVGDSATRAVVSGIVAIVVADGAFAVLYYFLNI